MNELSAAPQAGTRRPEVVQCPLPRPARKPLRQLWAGWRARRFQPATMTGMSVLSRNFGFKVFRTSMDFRVEPNEAKPSKQTQRRYFRKRARRVAVFLAPMWGGSIGALLTGYVRSAGLKNWRSWLASRSPVFARRPCASPGKPLSFKL